MELYLPVIWYTLGAISMPSILLCYDISIKIKKFINNPKNYDFTEEFLKAIVIKYPDWLIAFIIILLWPISYPLFLLIWVMTIINDFFTKLKWSFTPMRFIVHKFETYVKKRH